MMIANLDLQAKLVWTVDGVLSHGECAEQIERIDGLHPQAATINVRGGPMLDPNTRNNERVIFDDIELAGRLYQRVRPHLPDLLMGKVPVGVNERFRGYRYREGQRFAPHYDGSFQRSSRERSLLTFLIYLNEGFEGGETDFLELRQTIKPSTGQALLFQHFLLHEGCALKQGTKYALRSDIMYRETN